MGYHFLDAKLLFFESLDRRKVGQGSAHFLLQFLIETCVLELKCADMRRFHSRYSCATVKMKGRSDSFLSRPAMTRRRLGLDDRVSAIVMEAY